MAERFPPFLQRPTTLGISLKTGPSTGFTSGMEGTVVELIREQSSKSAGSKVKGNPQDWFLPLGDLQVKVDGVSSIPPHSISKTWRVTRLSTGLNGPDDFLLPTDTPQVLSC